MKKITKIKNNFYSGFIIGLIVATLFSMVLLVPQIKKVNKINLIMSLIDDNYVGVKDYDTKEENISNIYKGLLCNLDEYSYYYTEEEFKEFTDSVQGTYGGIGIVTQYSENLNHVVISHVYKGSPAEKAGLKKKDELLEVDGESLSNLRDINVASEKFRGDKGTELELLVLNSEGKKRVKVVRDAIEYASTEREVLNGIGYLKICTFDEKLPTYVKEDIKYFKEQGIENVILDLRNNSGGIVTSLMETLELLVPKQEIFRSKDIKGNEEVYSLKKGSELAFNYVLLVNSYTASCSEIFASLMKNQGYATLVGNPTAGKGCAQTIIPLYDGTGLKLTTDLWYDTKGNSIHEKGVLPDIRVKYKYLGDDEFELNKLEDTQILKALEQF